MLLPLPLGPRSSASLVLPAPGVEGAYLCVSVCVRVRVRRFVQPLPPKGVSLLPLPLCVCSLCGQVRRDMREMGTPSPSCLSLSSTLSLPCPLENAKTHDVNKSTMG